MSKPKHAHNVLIEAIGSSLIRKHFGLSYQRLHAWSINGIPYTHRAAFAQLANVHCVALPADFLAPPVAA